METCPFCGELIMESALRVFAIGGLGSGVLSFEGLSIGIFETGGVAAGFLALGGSGVDQEILRFLQQNWLQLLDSLDIPR